MPRLDVTIQMMVPADYREVSEVEAECFEHPWSLEDLTLCMRCRAVMGLVAKRSVGAGFVVAGYAVYELFPRTVQILNMAVRPEFRGGQVGEQLVQRLKEKLGVHRRQEILCVVRERNLDAQLFLKAQGFRWSTTIHGCYDADAWGMREDEDGYLMVWDLDRRPEGMPRNRLTKYVG